MSNIKIDAKPYYTKSFTNGTYDSIKFTICDTNGDIYVTIDSFIECDTSEYMELIDTIAKQYLNSKSN